MPLLEDKFYANLLSRFTSQRADQIMALCKDQETLANTPVHEFVTFFVT